MDHYDNCDSMSRIISPHNQLPEILSWKGCVSKRNKCLEKFRNFAFKRNDDFTSLVVAASQPVLSQKEKSYCLYVGETASCKPHIYCCHQWHWIIFASQNHFLKYPTGILMSLYFLLNGLNQRATRAWRPAGQAARGSGKAWVAQMYIGGVILFEK